MLKRHGKAWVQGYLLLTIILHTFILPYIQPTRLLSMVEDCFSEEPPDGNEQKKEDKSVQVIPPWFKQPLHQRQWAEHVPPKAVLQQLVARKDDLPACLIFYPINNQPHSIQGTWLASKSESFSETIVFMLHNT